MSKKRSKDKEVEELETLFIQLNKQIELLDKNVEVLTKGFMILTNELGLLENYPKKIIIPYEV